MYLYIKIYKYNLKLYLYVDFMKLLRCFCGKNLEHVKFGSMLGFLVVAGSYLKKAVLSLLSYRVKILFKLALGVGD